MNEGHQSVGRLMFTQLFLKMNRRAPIGFPHLPEIERESQKVTKRDVHSLNADRKFISFFFFHLGGNMNSSNMRSKSV